MLPVESPWRALAAAVVMQGITDARRHPDLAAWFTSADFALWLDLAGIGRTPDEARRLIVAGLARREPAAAGTVGPMDVEAGKRGAGEGVDRHAGARYGTATARGTAGAGVARRAERRGLGHPGRQGGALLTFSRQGCQHGRSEADQHGYGLR